MTDCCYGVDTGKGLVKERLVGAAVPLQMAWSMPEGGQHTARRVRGHTHHPHLLRFHDQLASVPARRTNRHVHFQVSGCMCVARSVQDVEGAGFVENTFLRVC